MVNNIKAEEEEVVTETEVALQVDHPE